jgi:hypothetical protein
MRVYRVFVVAVATMVLCLPAPRPAAAAINCGPFMATPAGPIQTCEAGIPSAALDVSAYLEPNYQLMNEWCWAASISGVFAYYGHPVSQARIVKEAYGEAVNMPGSPQAIMASLNRPWVDDAKRPFNVRSDIYSANWITAAQDLAQGLPLIVGSLGHAMIVTATEYQRFPNGVGQTTVVMVRDPWPTNARRRPLSPQEAYGVQMLIRIRVY